MPSQLFRRETGRRLRVSRDRIADTYLEHRYAWMAAFGDVRRDALLSMVNTLADVVERNDIDGYCAYTVNSIDAHLEQGFSPIRLLAAQQVFEDAVLAHLTPDQQELVGDLFLAARREGQAVLYERVIGLRAQGA